MVTTLLVPSVDMDALQFNYSLDDNGELDYIRSAS